MSTQMRYPGSFWHRAGCLQAIRDRGLLSMLSPEEQCAFVSEVADGRPLAVVLSIAARRDAAEKRFDNPTPEEKSNEQENRTPDERALQDPVAHGWQG